ncbi:MAG TPA: zf-HC2 domain-containing protein [Casimicrobiaceae bacterium]|jgi:hypothetical protein|nr:zf-HC2 domain-containing protein [Casimicrobiaceae bacterium]
MITCKEASRLLSQSQDRPLGRFEAWKLRVHLRLCNVCTRFAAQLRFMRDAMQRYRA